MYFLDANFWLVFSLKTLCAPRHVFGGVTALSQLTGPATWVDYSIVRNKRMPCPTFINFAFFSWLYCLIKDPTFIKF